MANADAARNFIIFPFLLMHHEDTIPDYVKMTNEPLNLTSGDGASDDDASGGDASPSDGRARGGPSVLPQA